jgi:hypothetical protein
MYLKISIQWTGGNVLTRLNCGNGELFDGLLHEHGNEE